MMKRRSRLGLILAVAGTLLLHVLFFALPAWRAQIEVDMSPGLLQTRLIAPAADAAKSKPPALVKVPTVEPVIPVPQENPPVNNEAAVSASEVSAVAATKADNLLLDAGSLLQEVTDKIDKDAPDRITVLPQSGHLKFSISKGEGGLIMGQAIHEWTHDGREYHLKSVTETTGLISIFKSYRLVQTSNGRFDKGFMKPEHFQAEKLSGEKESADFDWAGGQVTLSIGQTLPIGDGAQDLLSVFYQLVQAAQRGEHFIMGVATGKKLERYGFNWLEAEKVTVPAGEFTAWHVRVKPLNGDTDMVDVWLGKEVAGLPVKIRFTDRKGGVFEQRALEINYQGK